MTAHLSSTTRLPSTTHLHRALTAGEPFALLRREGHTHIEVATGDITTVESLAGIPLPATPDAATLAIVPYRQVTERGFEAVDDGAPLICLRITELSEVTVQDVLHAIDTIGAADSGGHGAADSGRPRRIAEPGSFDIDDNEYEDLVRRVLRDEIGSGEGSNFVIHRTYTAQIIGDPLVAALRAFRNLLSEERGAYWTFCVGTGDRTFVGATPERHVSVEAGLVMMNPISGTYRHPAGGPERESLLGFLADPKEIDELHMVLDEELKMMARVADLGGHIVGPFLKEMTHLSHTEYLLAGRSDLDVRDVLRETMFAPTVVGSPIENACRVVARNEKRGRRYYGGVLALLGTDAAGRQTLDAPILIRTIEFDHGLLRIPVGATLVRHSTPQGEVAETYAKARGVLAAIGARPSAADPEIHDALVARNRSLARFWIDPRKPGAPALAPELTGARVLVIDAEDTFTGMLTHQLRALGVTVVLRSYRRDPVTEGYDLVVAGPGPGDPLSRTDPKMGVLRRVINSALASGQPLLGICLGHQVLCASLGLPVVRKEAPYQGKQRTIDFFGRPELVGFYSTFSGVAPAALVHTPFGPVSVSRDDTRTAGAVRGEVHALRGETFAGVQFHPESVLTQHGVDLLRDLLGHLLGPVLAKREQMREREWEPVGLPLGGHDSNL